MRTWHVGQEVQRLRIARGWSQGQLADRAKVSRSFITKLEKGDREPTLEYVQKVASALGVSVATLVGDGKPQQGRSADARIANINANLLTMRELEEEEIERVEAIVRTMMEEMMRRRKEAEDAQRD